MVFDVVGGDPFDQACRSVNIKARILILGFASGRIPEYPVNLALLRSCSLIGVNHHHFFVSEPQKTAADMGELVEMYREGKVRPVIDRVCPLEQAAEAMNLVGDGKAIGKVILTVRS